MEIQPKARLTVVTLGVADLKKSAAFYDALGFKRTFGNESVAFYDAGGPAIGLFGWDALASDAKIASEPRPQAFRGTTLAWNCNSDDEVDATLAFAVSKGARLLKAAHATFYGGYSGYFSDPDGHPWEVVRAPGIEVMPDGRVRFGG